MRTTERIRPVALAGESVRSLPVVFISLFVAVAGVDVLLVTQPTLMTSLRDGWQGWMQDGVVAPWASVLGAAATIACVAVAGAVLTVVVRGIVDAPYVWLASALVAGCSFAISRMPVEVPLRLPTPLFACIAAVLLMGGGAFLHGRSTLLQITGTFLLATPFALLTIGYTRGRTSTGAVYVIDHNAQLLLGTLLIASVGTILIALAARRLSSMGGSAVLGAPSTEQTAELIDRARAGEQRAAEAEHRLKYLSGNAGADLDAEYELLRSRGSGLRRFAVWSLVALICAGSAYALFAGYLPLKQQLAALQKLNQTQTEAHAATILSLRAELDREREAMRQAAAATEPATAPAAAPEPPRAEPKPTKDARVSVPAATRTTKAVEHAAAAPLTRAGSKSQHETRTVQQQESAPQPTRSPVAKTDDPLDGLDGM